MRQHKICVRMALVAACVLAVSCAPEEQAREEQNHEQQTRAEQFAVLDSDDVALLDDERTIYINYWAVWCAPCIEEMPVLAEFREQNLEQVEVYGMNFDSPTLEQLRSDVERLDVRIPNLIEDPAPRLGVPTPQVLPSTFVVKDGEVVDILLGLQTLETLKAAIQ